MLMSTPTASHMRLWLAVFLVVGLGGGLTARAQLPAFPGAEGAGKFAVGGRGGDVYHVTNLEDSGPGSLRHGVETQTGPRTIVFDVGGNIELESGIFVENSYLTIAGQTAPGGGITLKGGHLQVAGTVDAQDNVVYTHDIVIRYLRFRPGDINTAPGVYEPDSLTVVRSRDVMLDHVSASWSTDEVLSTTLSDNVTVQWSMITEALHNSNHEKGNHGYGSIISGGDITFHHNLYASNRSRNPRPQGIDPNLPLTRVDFVNNVIYNPGGRYGYGGDDFMELNFVNNYGISGPDTNSGNQDLFFSADVETLIHQSGNLMDLNRDAALNGVDLGWGGISGTFTQSETRFAIEPTVTQSAADAYASVMTAVGASKYRDDVDQRILGYVASHGSAGALIDSQDEVGGWPALPMGLTPVDTDQDGMPDLYESSIAYLDPTNAEDRNSDGDSNGYTDLEDYLALLTSPAEAPSITLDVDRNSGEVLLRNSGQSDFEVLGYHVSSPLGGLAPGSWKSVADNYDSDGPNAADSGAFIGLVDADAPWNLLQSSEYIVEEVFTSGDGGALLARSALPLSVSGGWMASPSETDLSAAVLLSNGLVASIPVRYFGNGGNTLELGDFNADGEIDPDDWAIFLANFGADHSSSTPIEAYLAGDLDGDRDIDALDFVQFRSIYTAIHGPAAFQSLVTMVPEPGGAKLVLGTALLLGGRQCLRVRRRHRCVRRAVRAGGNSRSGR